VQRGLISCEGNRNQEVFFDRKYNPISLTIHERIYAFVDRQNFPKTNERRGAKFEVEKKNLMRTNRQTKRKVQTD